MAFTKMSVAIATIGSQLSIAPGRRALHGGNRP